MRYILESWQTHAAIDGDGAVFRTRGGFMPAMRIDGTWIACGAAAPYATREDAAEYLRTLGLS